MSDRNQSSVSAESRGAELRQEDFDPRDLNEVEEEFDGEDAEFEVELLAQAISEAGGAIGKQGEVLAIVLYACGVDTLYAAAELKKEDVKEAVQEAVERGVEGVRGITSINAGKISGSKNRSGSVRARQ